MRSPILALKELETAFQSLKFALVGKEATDPKHLRGPKVVSGCVCVSVCVGVCECVLQFASCLSECVIYCVFI